MITNKWKILDVNLQEINRFVEELGGNKIKHKLLELTGKKGWQSGEWVEAQEIVWIEEKEVDRIIATDILSALGKSGKLLRLL